MNLDHNHDNLHSAGLRLKSVHVEFTHPTVATLAVAINDGRSFAKPKLPLGNVHGRTGGKLLLLCLLFAGMWARGGPIIIGYTNCQAVAKYSQAQMDQIGQLKWYFTHASVGEYMMLGIAALHATNASYYQLHGIAAINTPPTGTEAGAIYEYDRGNPGWSSKLDIFKSCVSNGWRYPLVNIAMNKFCFIDDSADLTTTIDYMTAREQAYPETVFVYMTIPLETSPNWANYYRNIFNDGMRDWCRTNNRVLFDVADIEAHDTNGVLCTYTLSGRVCQNQWPGYNASGDGGHPDSPYAQRLLASGFYALAGALMSVDRDGDGVNDGQELIAGTRPLDRQSVFKLVTPALMAPGKVVLKWSSSTNRLYTLQRGTAFNSPASYTSLVVDAPATPPINTYTDSPPKTGSFFYRVSVRQ